MCIFCLLSIPNEVLLGKKNGNGYSLQLPPISHKNQTRTKKMSGSPVTVATGGVIYVSRYTI